MTDEVRHRRQVEDVGFAMLYHILTLDKDLSDGAFRLYALLLKYAQRKKHALPGLDRLGKELGKTRVTISRLMAELAGKGLITRQRRFGTSSITWIEDLNEIYKDVLAQMDDGNKNDTIVEGNKDDTKERGDCIKNNTSNVTGMLPKEEEAKNNKSHREEEKEEPPVFPKKLKERTDAIQPGPQDATAPDGPDNERSEAGNHQDSAGAILYSEGRGYPGLSLSDDRRDHEPAGERPDPTRLDLDRATLAKREELGGNLAVPPSAGGSFALGDRLITVACTRLGRSEPEGKKRDNARAFFEKVLESEGLLQGDVEMLEEAVKGWLDPEGDYAFYLPQYDLNPKHKLALRHFGIVLSKAKAQAAAQTARRARDEARNTEAQTVFEERIAARAPPKPVEEWNEWDYALSVLSDHPQVGRRFFEERLQATRQTGRIDGILTVAVPDEETVKVLSDRSIKRVILSALMSDVQGVEFEVET